ncbi:hypothetical protein B0H14DRAFT_3133026 [Mycena olivaceomarginata]|nr:hypothetical protein B0H14DRAFT_3133026 [Mycena olivaceomarginata]
MMNILHTTTLFVSAIYFMGSTSAAPINARATTTSPSFASLSKPIYAPYYVYFGSSSTPKMADAFDSLGMKAVTLGFASAPKGECALTTDLDILQPDAVNFVNKGGAVSLAFGGNLQDQTVPRQHVQQACTDAPSLTKLIQDSMTKFQTNNVEFDIEDNSLLSDTDSAKRLAQALVTVKKAVPNTYVTYTMGTGTQGMPAEQQAYLQAAKDAGLAVDAITLMTMNMGGTDNVADAQTAVAGGAQQVADVFGISTDDATKRMGMLPSIGVDNNGVVIDLTGATILGNFAKESSLATLSYWNFNRDFPGGDTTTQSLDSSSSPDQTNPSEFFTTFQKALAGEAPLPAAGAQKSVEAGTVDALTISQPGQKAALPEPAPAGAPGGA